MIGATALIGFLLGWLLRSSRGSSDCPLHKFSEEYDVPTRYICDVFAEMRKCDETKNYSYLMALIEEAQCMANHMEAALTARSDYRHWDRERKKVETEVRTLRKEVAKLRKKKQKLSSGQE